MSLLEQWREYAYQNQESEQQAQMFWANYFNQEMEIYKQILSEPETVVTGTVKELAEKYDVDLQIMVGFLDGINDSLKEANPIEIGRASCRERV